MPPRIDRLTDATTIAAIEALIARSGGDPSSLDGRLVAELMLTSLKMLTGEHQTGQLKLISRAVKEMRYAYRVFNRYPGSRKVSIFGSARTPEDHPDYVTARAFGAAVAQAGWMSITGAGNGIMKAGHEGPQSAASFGLSIRLPFETTANTIIHGDPKLINFRYFFTRKLMFLSHSDAVAVFPGGFGTQDELFEVLTLVQTGKSNMIPIVLLEGPGGHYWPQWNEYVQRNLLGSGWISAEDPGIYHMATSVEDALEHILAFYRVYHSSRYVGDTLVMRMREEISDAELDVLNVAFADLVKRGRIERSAPLPPESDHLDLPRLVFQHTRAAFGRLRAMISRINSFADRDRSKALRDP